MGDVPSPPHGHPPPSSAKGLLVVLGLLLLVGLVAVLFLGDAWMTWFPSRE